MCKCIQEDKSDKSVKMTHTNWNKKGDEDEDDCECDHDHIQDNHKAQEKMCCGGGCGCH